MTDRHLPKHPPVAEPEEDKLPYGKLFIVSAIALLLFFVGGLWSTYLLVRPHGTLNPELRPPVPTALKQYEVGIVNQRLFTGDLAGERSREEQKRRLSSYGWVDRGSNRIHIPVEQAMQQLVEGQR